MIEVEFLLVLILIGVVVIDHRLSKLVKIQRDIRTWLERSDSHLSAMRKYYEPPEPEPPPLTLDEAPQTEIRAKE